MLTPVRSAHASCSYIVLLCQARTSCTTVFASCQDLSCTALRPCSDLSFHLGSVVLPYEKLPLRWRAGSACRRVGCLLPRLLRSGPAGMCSGAVLGGSA